MDGDTRALNSGNIGHTCSFMGSRGCAGPGLRGDGTWLTLDEHGPCTAAKCYGTREGGENEEEVGKDSEDQGPWEAKP